jgi:hypothetical protein
MLGLDFSKVVVVTKFSGSNLGFVLLFKVRNQQLGLLLKLLELITI